MVSKKNVPKWRKRYFSGEPIFEFVHHKLNNNDIIVSLEHLCLVKYTFSDYYEFRFCINRLSFLKGLREISIIYLKHFWCFKFL